MNNLSYPLGHSTAELDRLDMQAILVHDPFLDELAIKSRSCLEIGCGNGANLPLLRRANPDIHYTGIDISPQAVEAAKYRFSHDKNANFFVIDGKDINLAERFDLIFTKLVLWSAGTQLREILSEARRLLAPGGTFYALEPCNQLIQIFPHKPAATRWMQSWNQAAISQGLNPYIGTEIPGELIKAGFQHVDTKFHTVIALGNNLQKYTAIMENMMGFFMGPAADKFELDAIAGNNRILAINELQAFKRDNFVMDGLFAAWGS